MKSLSLENSTMRDRIVAVARLWIDTPYCHQASCKGQGADCLGLVRGVWREVIGPEPETLKPYTPDWAETSRDETLLDAAHRHFIPQIHDDFAGGDLLLFRWQPNLPAKHIAIASSRSTMIHAHQGVRVCEVNLTPWWRRHLVAAFAFPQISS